MPRNADFYQLMIPMRKLVERRRNGILMVGPSKMMHKICAYFYVFSSDAEKSLCYNIVKSEKSEKRCNLMLPFQFLENGGRGQLL